MNETHVRPGIRNSRNELPARVRLRHATREWQADTLDLSLTGVRIIRPAEFTLLKGTHAELLLQLPESEALRVNARVVRLGDDDVALRFEAVGPQLEEDLRRALERYGRLRDEFGEA